MSRSTSVALLLSIGVALFACRGDPRETKSVPSPGAPVSPVDSTLARADSLYLEGDLDEARSIWRSALSGAEARRDSSAIATLLTSLGLAARREAQYEEARELLERSLSLKQRLGMQQELFRSLNGLGMLSENEGRLAEATAFYEQATRAAQATGDSLSSAKAAHNLGLVYGRLGDFEGSRAGISRLRDVARAEGDSVSLSRSLSNLAKLELDNGDPIAALALFEEVRTLTRVTGDVELEENVLGQLAMTWDALGDPARALASLDSALALARQHGMRRQEGEDLRLLGDLYLDAGDFQRALTSYAGAQEIMAALELPEETGDVLLSIAEAQLALGRPELARQRAEEALRIHRTGGFHFAVFGDLATLAELAQASGRSNDAEQYLRSASALASTLRTEMAATDLALAEARVADRAGDWRRVLAVLDAARGPVSLAGNGVLWEAHAMRARAYRKLNQVEAAVAAGRLALDVVERVRQSYSSGALRTSYVSSKAALYAEQVVALLQANRIAEAFEVADAARGRALVDHLLVAREDIRRTSGAAGSLLDAETLLRRIDSLTARVRELEQSRPPGERSAALATDPRSLGARLAAARDEYEALLVRLNDVPPAGAALLNSAPTHEAAVRASLGAEEALLEYFILPDRLLIFVVTRDTVRTIASPIAAEDLVARVRLARDLMGRQDVRSAQVVPVLEALYNLLVRPALAELPIDRIRRLLIVPHATLAYLPFSALRDSSTGRHLVERFALLHLPTASALPALRATPPRPMAGGRNVALAPLVDALPASRKEVQQFRRSVRSAEVLIGTKASESALRIALTRGGIVHVATHGTMNSRNPMFSRIELSPGTGPARSEDGRLEVHEVLGLRITSPLVFLSGCETGLGTAWSTSFDRADDYATLAQAFLYAGARNVVATLWRVADEGAAALAERFYPGLSSLGAADALAAAQRSMIADKRYGSPYFWAGYQVSGDGIAAMPGTVHRVSRR